MTPIDYADYPDNWLSEIRPKIMARARGYCECLGECGINHGSPIEAQLPAGRIRCRLRLPDKRIRDNCALRAVGASIGQDRSQRKGKAGGVSVYVGHSFGTRPSRRWPYKTACHLYADTLDELHEFAARIGLKRGWIDMRRVPHYDLTGGMRRKAIRAGAIEVDRQTEAAFGRKYNRKEEGNNAGAPDDRT